MSAPATIRRPSLVAVLLLGTALGYVASNGVASAQCTFEILFADDGSSSDFFGTTAALSGDRCVVGSPFQASQGAAYVYRTEGTSWVQEAKLVAAEGLLGDRFGVSVAMDGDLIVVGAPFYNEGSSNTGGAFVFRRSGTTWSEEAKLVASDAAPYDLFGTSVAVSGNVVAVGADHEDQSGSDAGAVYLYRYNGGSWSQEKKIRAGDAATGDLFGTSVALNIDRVLVGAPGNSSSSGSAYVFLWDGLDWTQEAKLTPSDALSGELFGQRVALGDTFALVGVPNDDELGTEAGAAFSFKRDGTLWSLTDKLMGAFVAPYHHFGSSLAMSGPVALIGCPGDDLRGSNTGTAYGFRLDGQVWNQITQINAGPSAAPGNLFGSAVAVDGAVAVITSPSDDDLGTGSGSAHLFSLGLAAASWSNYGIGWPGTYGIPDIAATDNPRLGAEIQINISNSRGAATPAVFLIGYAPAAIGTPLGGTLFVLPSVTVGLVIPFPVMQLPALIPWDCFLTGFSAYFQAIEQDPGASDGWSFTPGLQFTFGL